jgi:hypothetical protein
MVKFQGAHILAEGIIFAPLPIRAPNNLSSILRHPSMIFGLGRNNKPQTMDHRTRPSLFALL